MGKANRTILHQQKIIKGEAENLEESKQKEKNQIK